MKMNKLKRSSSPYLLQHADNPVNWYPWGDEALAKAKKEHKPILLSIGYSACHWCHVMAEESFEDPVTANIMNKYFVCIKVDREERPDLDKIYQTAHYFITQKSGGWPLTMFLSPDDLIPFFGGTYFPKEAIQDLIPFKKILMRAAAYFQEHETERKAQGQQLQSALSKMNEHEISHDDFNASPISKAFQYLVQLFDADHGGFGTAPKFPHTNYLNFLLQLWQLDENEKAKAILLISSKKMADGGLQDHLGGGFFRYCTDNQWQVPHFEKMLYDNAQLLSLYADLAFYNGDKFYRKTATATADWILRKMAGRHGGFCSSLDADSGGEEGGFYLWDKANIKEILTSKEYKAVKYYFGLDQEANCLGEWHLTAHMSAAELASKIKLSVRRTRKILEKAKHKLFLAQEQSHQPFRDEKILTSTNGLVIHALAKAGQLLEKEDYIQAAQDTIDFVRKHLWQDKRLLASFKDEASSLPGYLDDYAFMLYGLLQCLQAKWRDEDLQFAIEIANSLTQHFYDKDRGGFFFTADDHERLIQRPKSFNDDAIPSGNGIAVLCLQQLYFLTGDKHYHDIVTNSLRGAWHMISTYPSEHCVLLQALEAYLHPPRVIILRGKFSKLTRWQRVCNLYRTANQLCFAIPDHASHLPKALEEKKNTAKATAYICEGVLCKAPIHKKRDLVRFLQE